MRGKFSVDRFNLNLQGSPDNIHPNRSAQARRIPEWAHAYGSGLKYGRLLR